MTPQPLLELAKAATKGPWRVELTQATAWVGTPKGDTKINHIVCGIAAESDLKKEARDRNIANAQLIARLNPEVAVRVYELLQDLSRYVAAMTYADGPCIEKHDLKEIKAVIRLLDGNTTEDQS